MTLMGQSLPDNCRHRGPDTGNSSRTLIYVPIIHTPADMGALQESVARATVEKWGRTGLTRKMQRIEEIWMEIERSIDCLTLSFDKVRLYQDGLPVCGRESEIVADLAQKGSCNHQLLLRLMAQGATLMGTESGDLLVQEYQQSLQSLTSRPPRSAGVMARRQALADSLLQQRDQFIAQRINETLQRGETGILFLGVLHAVASFLPQDIKVICSLQRSG
ncbi:MAG: hypothetical protein ACYDIC_15895 [Desulfobaccales bacterium]